MLEWAIAGTTLTMSKKGSGVPDLVNPCIEAYLETQEYYTICVKYGLEGSCFKNEYFPEDGDSGELNLWDIPTNELTTDCSSGYCKCP
jgi:hypothetical protein